MTGLVVENLRNALVGPVNLRVEPGTCAAISGASGAGKSLLLRMIADLDPHTGTARLGDIDRAALPAPAWRRRVVYLAAESGWWRDTVLEHVEPGRRDAAEALAHDLGLEAAVLERRIPALSSGERQRSALIRALVTKPAALLLDEPTSALDPSAIQRVEAVLRAYLAEGHPIVLVTHAAEQAARLGAHRYVMEQGRLRPL